MSTIIAVAQVSSEEITIDNQAIQLSGTLTYMQEKSPLLIWVHGSGRVDRNGNQPQYIKQFRAAVTKRNIAFFSYDKRTANPKNMVFLKEDILISDFIFDVEEVVRYFKKDNRFDKIILVGHSQGSLIAMKSLKDVDKYISIAGAGETINKTLIRQVSAQNAAYGKLTVAYFKELKKTGVIKEVTPNLFALFAPSNQPFLASWMALSPVEEIKNVRIPTLIINGDKDIQVPVSDAKALKRAKPDAELVIVKNMNQILKDIQKDEDNLKSYSSEKYPVSEKLIQAIVSFVKK